MIEADKSRDVRRGASRFLRHIKQSEKSSKERIKKLSAVNRITLSNEENYEMGCDIVEREETPSTSGSAIAKRFKLPRKKERTFLAV
ncbi:conserved hypothetical protein [Ricinus communis]|uniref:Uncharacterized protein n=1 Tax=Ricinus communis TaxID=3988 RepID=B9R886_RICCO|nr:conserved hypothetical protein [Ricinus communis]